MSERASTRAILSLVFGLLAWLGLGCCGAILAVILGQGEDHELARVGRLLGWIHLAVVVVAVFFGLIALAVMAAVGAFD